MPKHIGTLVGEAYIRKVDGDIVQFDLGKEGELAMRASAPVSLFSRTPQCGEMYRMYVLSRGKVRTQFEYVPLPPFTAEDAARIEKYRTMLREVL